MADTNHYDIAIIGGGLAGLCLAIQSAGKGYRTILFEKEEYPFNKVCGEYVGMESFDFLQRLGVPLKDWNLPFINKLQVSDPAGVNYEFNLSPGGFGISRYKLDEALYQIALSSNVSVITKTKVNNVEFTGNLFSVYTGAVTYHATVCAGSFGKRSNLDVKMKRSFIDKKPGKLNNYIGVKYHVHFAQQPGTINLHNFKDGYCGISQIEDGKCCLCYLTTANNLKASGNSIKEMEKNILWKNPMLKLIFTTSVFLYDAPLVISQVSFNKKSQAHNHMLMLGDAAGLITPLCGNGMSMAMHASKLAFVQIDLFLNKQITRTQMEKAYSKNWLQKFKIRLATGRIVQRFFGGASTSLFLRLIKMFPALANRLIDATHGKSF